MRRVVTLVTAACVNSGCDTVFNIDHVTPATDAMTCVPVGHDEDHDGLDDACDPCPFADDDEIDIDGDGIAGICDPDPATPNQRIMFSGLQTADVARFTTNGGELVDDAYHTDPSLTSSSMLWPMTVDRVWVTAGVDVLSVGTTDAYHEVGLIVEANAGTSTHPNGMFCVLGRIGTTSYNEVYVYTQGSGETSLNSTAPNLDISGFVGGIIRASYSSTMMPQLGCTFLLSGTAAGISASRSDIPLPGGVGLFTESAEAKFQFLFVVTRP